MSAMSCSWPDFNQPWKLAFWDQQQHEQQQQEQKQQQKQQQQQQQQQQQKQHFIYYWPDLDQTLNGRFLE